MSKIGLVVVRLSLLFVVHAVAVVQSVDCAPAPLDASLKYAAERNGTGAPAHLGQTVRVRGMASVGPRVFSREYTLFYIQDGEAGIAVYRHGKIDETFEPGALVEVTGTIRVYNGEPQIAADKVRVIRDGLTVHALEVEPHEINSSRFTGRLVQTEAVVETTAEHSGTSLHLAAADGTLLRVYLSRNQSGDLVRKFRRGERVRVTGIASQFDPEPPYRSGWQLRPRAAADVTTLPGRVFAEAEVLKGAFGLGGAVFVALAWVWTLRRKVRSATASLAETIAVLHAQRQALPGGILVIDRNRTVKDFNTRFLEIWGVTAESVSGVSFGQIASMAGDSAEVTKKLREMDENVTASCDLTIPDGRIISATRTPLDDGEGALWTFRDITEHELMREQIARSVRVASLGRLAAGIAHEFNNVLMSIQPHAEIIRRKHPEAADSVDRILSAVERGRRTTSDVLGLTRPVEVEKRDVRISDLMNDLEAELRASLQPGVDLIFGSSDPKRSATFDRGQMMQVFVNIALNAQQAMNGSGHLRVKCDITAQTVHPYGILPSATEYVHFEFHDDGPGITADLIDHVFEPLFSSKKRHGSGLGLAIAHRIVVAHDGAIFVESVPGQFTTFHVFIPVGAAGEKADHDEQMAAVGDGRYVLLVEDDAHVADAISAILREKGYLVEHVGTGKAAMDSAAAKLPDIAIIDLDLPDIPGERVYETMTSQWPSLPVVLSSGHLERLEGSGGTPMLALLPKPYDSARLFAEIDRLVVRRVA